MMGKTCDWRSALPITERLRSKSPPWNLFAMRVAALPVGA
jgi:hypothetical protein